MTYLSTLGTSVIYTSKSLPFLKKIYIIKEIGCFCCATNKYDIPCSVLNYSAISVTLYIIFIFSGFNSVL